MPLDAAVTHVRCGTALEYADVPRLDGTAAACSGPAATALGALFVIDAQDAAALDALESVIKFVCISRGLRAAGDVHSSCWRRVSAAGDSISAAATWTRLGYDRVISPNTAWHDRNIDGGYGLG
jgi:hypothetical protein